MAGLVSAAMLGAGARRGCGARARGACPTQDRRGCLGGEGAREGWGSRVLPSLCPKASLQRKSLSPLQGTLGRRWSFPHVGLGPCSVQPGTLGCMGGESVCACVCPVWVCICVHVCL